MEGLFANVNHWHWWILAVALVVLEAFAPGTFFLWMGISAAVVGPALEDLEHKGHRSVYSTGMAGLSLASLAATHPA